MSLARCVGVASLVVALGVSGFGGCGTAPSTAVDESHPVSGPGPAGTAASTPTPAPASTPAVAPSADADAIDKVLAISVDGLNPDAISQLGPSGAPAFHRMMREGASTLNARTEYEQTQTLPNHTGMLTSRRIDRTHGGHGVTINTDTGTTVHKRAHHYVASVFDVVHDRGGSTALFAAKTKFALYDRTWNTEGRDDTVGQDNGRRKIDRVTLDENNTRLVAALNAELRTDPRTFTFLHVALPDAAGHAHGFMGPEYLDAVRQTDRLLGSVLDTVAARPALKAQLLVVLTADHGGSGGTSHTDPAKPADYRVPFLAWGPRVPADTDLYALNPSFADPGGRRPTYTGRQPIRNGVLANLATDALDLPPVPGSTLDRPRRLTVAR